MRLTTTGVPSIMAAYSSEVGELCSVCVRSSAAGARFGGFSTSIRTVDAPRERGVQEGAPGGGKAAYAANSLMNKDFTLSRYALKDGERNMSTLWACA